MKFLISALGSVQYKFGSNVRNECIGQKKITEKGSIRVIIRWFS